MFLPSLAAHNALKRIRPDLPSDPTQVRCRNGHNYAPNEATVPPNHPGRRRARFSNPGPAVRDASPTPTATLVPANAAVAANRAATAPAGATAAVTSAAAPTRRSNRVRAYMREREPTRSPH